VAELQALRQDHEQLVNVDVAADTEVPVPRARGDCLELCLEVEPGGATEFGLKVRCAPDGSEETIVSLTSEPSSIQIDYRRASLRDDLTYQDETRIQAAPFDFKQGEHIRLRVFLDRSVLEVFAGDRRYMAQRIYPTSPEAVEVRLFSRGGHTLFKRLSVWKMGGDLRRQEGA
ncbi:MAG: hypothetical protein HOC05_15820, partial [Gemmatimonadetes bacterium]|nr:hypothetical protein [Gemmatimonadota bacterium]